METFCDNLRFERVLARCILALKWQCHQNFVWDKYACIQKNRSGSTFFCAFTVKIWVLKYISNDPKTNSMYKIIARSRYESPGREPPKRLTIQRYFPDFLSLSAPRAFTLREQLDAQGVHFTSEKSRAPWWSLNTSVTSCSFGSIFYWGTDRHKFNRAT